LNAQKGIVRISFKEKIQLLLGMFKKKEKKESDNKEINENT